MVDASSSGNIKPGFVLQDYYKFIDTAGEFDFIITREDTYTNIGTEENPSFVPLYCWRRLLRMTKTSADLL